MNVMEMGRWKYDLRASDGHNDVVKKVFPFQSSTASAQAKIFCAFVIIIHVLLNALLSRQQKYDIIH